ncbi:SAM-dependent methyltransferase [Streptomyces lonarensis]|uniref:Methyltransferase domain-containing protein n=1 Tax=Streptomyces lonarensis TaxID=700599 RepID=A0A7X6HYM8_9ACTN|nr:SAM-dependent methyltransferase [Streptomyces lonarensis]NJQ05595.1 methyltransferase domain-containing protein [Streptomyces lonarensis]
MSRSPTPDEYFDAMYRRAEDPWGLAERWYERRKYALTLASLPGERYRNAFEAGCSVGELTRGLAGRCDRLLACDRVAAAVGTARRRTAELRGVTVERRVLPEEWPEGRFDLVVLSEVLYYLDTSAFDVLVRRAVESLEPDGALVTVHWDHPVADHVMRGSEVADRLADAPGLALLADHREEDFVLQVHQRPALGRRRPPSVAAREGLV